MTIVSIYRQTKFSTMVKIDENGNKVNVWTESHMDTTTLEIPSLRGGHRPTWQSHVILRFPRFARNDVVMGDSTLRSE